MVLLAGRFAGKKAVVVKSYDEGSNDKKFPHALGAFGCKIHWLLAGWGGA